MKKLLFLFFISLSAQAVELKFIGPCMEDFIMRVDVNDEYTNVGELTVATLAKFDIPFKGTAAGLASAFNTPTGKDATEVVSADESRAYGWCFSVDGVAPDLYPNDVPVTIDTKVITWHFGYARLLKGKWITQCTAAYKVKPAFLCQDPTAER
jgi:hypothetical protein